MRTRRWAPLCCALLVIGFLADLQLRPGGVHMTRTIDDIAEMLAAAPASRARGRRGFRRCGLARAAHPPPYPYLLAPARRSHRRLGRRRGHLVLLRADRRE